MSERIMVIVLKMSLNNTAATAICTLSLHDALPMLPPGRGGGAGETQDGEVVSFGTAAGEERSEEHTSELQSRQYLVCRLLLEKKNTYPALLSRTPLVLSRAPVLDITAGHYREMLRS